MGDKAQESSNPAPDFMAYKSRSRNVRLDLIEKEGSGVWGGEGRKRKTNDYAVALFGQITFSKAYL